MYGKITNNYFENCFQEEDTKNVVIDFPTKWDQKRLGHYYLQ